MATRYVYGTFRTYDRAEQALEDDFATGAVSQGERPKIEPVRDHRRRITAYQITLESY